MLALDIVINVWALVLGLRAYNSHQISLYKNFSLLYGVCIISRIILAYLNT
jgi:hypothetical protein